MIFYDKPQITYNSVSTNILLSFKRGQEQEIQDLVDAWQTIEGEVEVEVKKKRKKRSLDANALYFSLTRQVADRLQLPLAEVHNTCLAECGIAWLDNEGHKKWLLLIDNDEWKKQNTIHYAPTDRTEIGKDGNAYRYFYLLLPTHLMNSKQMAIVIDNMVQNAKSLGIAVRTHEFEQALEEMR